MGEKLEAVGDIRRKMQGRNKALEETVFYAGEVPVNDMVSILRNGALFAEARLFLLKNAELIKTKDEVKLLCSYMEAPAEDTALILLSDAASLDKGLEKAAGEKRIFWELFENRKAEWVASFFRREGCRISEAGIETILELVENNTEALKQECSRLIAFLGKDRPIEAAEVETWLSHTREESAFTLFSRIAAGDLTKSIETLHAILGSKESPQAVLGGLTWCFRRFRDYLGLADAGVRDEFEFKKRGLGSAKARNDYAALRRRYHSADTCLALIAEFDILLRSLGSAPESILMDLLILKLVSGQGHTREKWLYY